MSIMKSKVKLSSQERVEVGDDSKRHLHATTRYGFEGIEDLGEYDSCG